MSLATRCPSCGTIFRVVQDQLKVSEGWVRCGQCQEVFHGVEALFDLESDPVVAARRAARAGLPAAPAPARVFAPAPAPARAAIAPRFAARLAEESARRQGSARPAPANEVQAPGPSPRDGPAPGAIPSRFLEESVAAIKRERASDNAWASPPAGPSSPSAISSSSPRPLFGAPAPQPATAPSLPGFDSEIPLWLRAVPPAPTSTQPPDMPRDPDLSDAGTSPMRRPRTIMPRVAPPSTEPEAPVPAPEMPQAAEEPVPALPRTAEVLDVHPEGSRIFIPSYPPSDAGASTIPSMLADDAAYEAPRGDDEGEDDEHADPPTLASMLPEDGEWPPRRKAEQRDKGESASTAVALLGKDDPRFLREARRSMRWSRPWVRASLSLALLVLIATAAAQVAWPQREVLASRFPATLAAWQWACEQAGCTIAAPRALASLALDGSSLTRTDVDHVLLFSADLHNRADHAVRMPSFDLSFMDLNGEIVARKVLAPAQIGIRVAALAPDAELHVHARIQVGNADASGFQAEMFYP